MPIWPLYAAVGFVIALLVLYFISWLCQGLKNEQHPIDEDLELGKPRKRIEKTLTLRPSPSEAFFLSNCRPQCCISKNRVSSNHCCRNNYCSRELLSKLEACISSAKSSICVAMFNFNSGEVCEFIMRLHLFKGNTINIRILVDKSSCAEGKNKQAKKLMETGISVRVNGGLLLANDEAASEDDNSSAINSLMHNKFCIIDGELDSGVLITGSLNWTYTALTKHAENVIFNYEDHIRKDFLEFFNHLWENSTELKTFLNTSEIR